MNQREARQHGNDAGRGAARYCEVGDSDRRQAECDCEAPAECAYCLTAAAYEAESNARDFSPWEFIAHEINESGDRAEGLWQAYDAGVAAGIRAGVQERVREKNPPTPSGESPG